jgi:pimeloyl-ACP methyl ester carboxylesterase
MARTEIRSERIRANGLEFHVNAAGEGDRLALCLHGFPELGMSWRHQLPLLASLGYRAWAPDLRGYGGSDRPKGSAHYAIEKLLDDVAGLIDAAGPRETVMIAHDWGAMIAWQFAAHAVRPLDRLVILNGPPPGLPKRPSLAQLRRSAYVFFFQLPWLPEWVFARRGHAAIEEAFRRAAGRPERLEEADLRRYREAAAKPGATTAMIDYYRALVRGGGMRRMTARGFPTIETPTLLIWGAADPVLVPSMTDAAGEWVKDVTRRFLPSVGHWVQQEAPDEVNDILSAWLTDAPVPGNLHWEQV